MNTNVPHVCIDDALTGRLNTNVLQYCSTQGNNNNLSRTTQPFHSGNGCGHDKKKLKIAYFYGMTGASAKSIPFVLQETGRLLRYLGSVVQCKTLKQIKTISDSNKSDIKLISWYLALLENEKFTNLLTHKHKSRANRRRRSESIESVIFLTLGSIISSVSLHNMVCGHYNNKNRFVSFDYGYIAKTTGQSIYRVMRAMKVLKELNLIDVQKVNQTLDDGRIITKEVRISLSDEIFTTFGLEKEFLSDRAYASTKHAQREQKINGISNIKYMYKKSLKPKIDKPKVSKPFIPSLNKTIPGIMNKMSTYKAPSKGNSEAILNLYNQLIHKGLTPQEAIQITKTQYPPG